jgi:hypothetical protein
MLRLRDILNVLTRKGNAGATVDDFRNEYGNEEIEDIKRLLQAAQDLNEIKKDGKGRGVRYYLIDVQIPEHKVRVGGVRKISEENFIEGVIDVSGITSVKEKIDKIIESDHKLQEIHRFTYRKKLDKPLYGRELYDYINHSVVDVDVMVGYDIKKKKNAILYSKEKISSNKLIISREPDGRYAIVKIHLECPDRPEIQRFTLISEFEKCLRTIVQK